MKKLIPAMIILLAALLLFGCAGRGPAEPEGGVTEAPAADPAAVGEAVITDGSHPREEEYKSPFQTRMIDTPLAAVHMETGGEGTDEALRTLAAAVVSDVLKIADRTGEAPRKVTVYVVRNLLRDSAQLIDDHLLCSAADIETGAYRGALIGACYAMPLQWKQAGLEELVFGAPDESGLAQYYSDEAHALTASCAGVFFQKGAADEQTLNAARQTAAGITAFILETGGFDALKAAKSTAQALPAWAEKLGFAAPKLPEGSDRAACMIAYSDLTPNVICTLRIGSLTMNVHEGSFAQTADELYSFVCRFFVGADLVLSRIAEEAPFLSGYAEEHFNAPFTIKLLDDPTQSGMNTTWGDTIDLRYENAAWHELVHWLLWKGDDNKTTMLLQESAAEYFSNTAMSLARQVPYDEDEEREYYNSEDLSERDRSFYLQAMELYLIERGKDPLVPPEIVNYQRLRCSYAVCSLLLQYDPMENYSSSSLAGARGHKAGQKAKDPNALTYFEANLLLEYLFDSCGTENVMRGYWDNKSLEEICGMEYPELYQAFIAHLDEEYGALLTPID